MDIDKQQVLELLYDAIEREDWSLVEEATRVIKGESDFDEFETRRGFTDSQKNYNPRKRCCV